MVTNASGFEFLKSRNAIAQTSFQSSNKDFNRFDHSRRKNLIALVNESSKAYSLS